LSKSKHVVSWRRRTKARMVAAFGGKCCVCQKEYPQEVFEFHHLDPAEKDFAFGSVRSNCLSWDKIVNELRKCVMVCANCHRLVEYGHGEIPENAFRFDESYVDYKKLERKQRMDRCRCGREKLKSQKFCSIECSNFYSRKVEWPSKDVLKDLLKYKSLNQIGKLYGVTHSAVKRWKRRYGL